MFIEASIKVIFPGSLECPLYTGLTNSLSIKDIFPGSRPLYTGLSVYDLIFKTSFFLQSDYCVCVASNISILACFLHYSSNSLVFNAIFNNISVAVSFIAGGNHRPVTSLIRWSFCI
jgi:hypothetical protein